MRPAVSCFSGTSPLRRTSIATSSSSSVTTAASGTGASTDSWPWAARIGRMSTTSRKLLRYWTQSHTTRTRDRSTESSASASTTGPSAAVTSTGLLPRSLPVGRKSTSTASPLTRCPVVGCPVVSYRAVRAGADAGPLENLRDAPLVVEGHHMRPRDPGDLGEPLDDLDADLHALIGDPRRRDAAQPADHGIGHVDAGDLGTDVLQGAQ